MLGIDEDCAARGAVQPIPFRAQSQLYGFAKGELRRALIGLMSQLCASAKDRGHVHSGTKDQRHARPLGSKLRA